MAAHLSHSLQISTSFQGKTKTFKSGGKKRAIRRGTCLGVERGGTRICLMISEQYNPRGGDPTQVVEHLLTIKGA